MSSSVPVKRSSRSCSALLANFQSSAPAIVTACREHYSSQQLIILIMHHNFVFKLIVPMCAFVLFGSQAVKLHNSVWDFELTHSVSFQDLLRVWRFGGNNGKASRGLKNIVSTTNSI